MNALPGDNPSGTLPFEGSGEIAGIVAGLIEKWKVKTFVETGTQRGATALWAAAQHIRVITIESDLARYEEALGNLEGSEITAYRGDSVSILPKLKFKPKERVLFFLDAHSMQGTPIINELRAIGCLIKQFLIKPIICIHDIEVPDHPELGFDRYEDGTVLNLDLIHDMLIVIGMADWPARFNSIPDGAARGFCYIEPK